MRERAAPTTTARNRPSLRRRLLAWFDAHARDLPWRRTRDAYAIWVSEAMLQQTQVAVVLPYYAAWMRRFPTVQALARAPRSAAMAAWSGLGYYARAWRLHEAARRVVNEHGGTLPADPARLRGLPGFGPYTTAAVASMAFGVPMAAVDGNVRRVLARLDGAQRDEAGVRARATELLDPRRPGDWNQALMELGALVCRPRKPRCATCPWADACTSRGVAVGQARPARRGRVAQARPVQTVRWAVASTRTRVLLVQPARRGLLAGTWTLPGHDLLQPPLPQPRVRSARAWCASLRQAGLDVAARPVARFAHAFSHRAWDVRVHRATGREDGRAVGGGRPENWTWVPTSRLRGIALSSVARRALESAGVVEAAGPGARMP